MTTCQKCNTDVAIGSQFCPNCGTPANHRTESERFSDERPSWLDDPSVPPAPPAHVEPVAPWQPQSDATVVLPPAGATPPSGPPPAQPYPPRYVPGPHPPPAVPPFTGAGAGGPPFTGAPQFLSPDEQAEPNTPNAGKLVGVGLGVIGLIAVGFLGIRFVTGGSGGGGAASPEDVATEMVEAINAQDPLALVSLFAPDELDGLDDLVDAVSAYSDELRLTELLDDDASSATDTDTQIVIDIEIDDIDVSMEGDDAAVVAFELSGDLEIGGVEGILDADDDDFDLDFDSRDLEGALPNGTDAVEMIVVRLDGKWYASPMLTAGHYIVENNDLDGGDYAAIGDADDRDAGADDAVGAVGRLADVLSDPDADDLAAVLGGGEGRAALVFRDAIAEGLAELDDSNVRLGVSVDAIDIGSGRVEVQELTIDFADDVDRGEVRLQGDCARVTRNGDRSDEVCVSDALDLDNLADLDRRLIIETVDEAGSRRVRIIPTITETLGRFVGLVEDRDVLLAGTGLAVNDSATVVEPGTDIDIAFDGQLFTVHRFEVEADETYQVTAAGDTALDLYIDEGFGLQELLIEYGGGRNRDTRFDRAIDDGSAGNFDRLSGRFTPFGDGVVRVVTYSTIDGSFEDGDCRLFECLPNGEGSTTLRIRQAGRQTVDFPQRISGELGPGDVRVFDIVVDDVQSVEIEVTGTTVAWDLPGVVGTGNVWELDRGTYQLIVYNTSGDEGTSYAVTPTVGS